MEGPERRGAGPETTGDNNEQLTLFTTLDHEAWRLGDEDIARATREINDSISLARTNALGLRSQRLLARDHPSVRGDRLEGSCLRHDRRNN